MQRKKGRKRRRNKNNFGKRKESQKGLGNKNVKMFCTKGCFGGGREGTLPPPSGLCEFSGPTHFSGPRNGFARIKRITYGAV
jgi:hypothetical protein